MKAVAILSVMVLAAAVGLGAEPDHRDPAQTPELDRSDIGAVVDALYRAVSFDRGGQPDWATLRSLFLKGAVLAQPRRGTGDLELLSVEEFVSRFKGDLETFEDRGTGFSEQVAGSTCTTFGRTAHCRVVFEARFDPDNRDPVGRGVDDIQLVQNGEQWWIAAIATDYERTDQPIPHELLAVVGEVGSDDEGPLTGCTKLGFEVSELDEHGLVGPEGGKVALSYEFCLPRDQRLVDEVRAIDPTVAIQAGSPGRLGCGPTQVLCVGSTYQAGFLEVLAGLCDLEYIARIERAVFE